MKFRFRLARVLKVKGIWEQQAKLKLAAAVAAREREEHLLRQKAAYLQTAWGDLTVPGTREAHRMAEHYMLAHMAKGDYGLQEARVQNAQFVCAGAQREFVKRRAQRRVLSRLEEKRRTAFVQEERRTDLRRLDEVAAISHLKHQRRV